MKKLLSLIVAGTLSLVLAGWALSQVPASLVRSGIIIGTAGAQSAISGSAQFNPSSGSIASLVTRGVVTGVTYTSAGLYAVTISGSPSNYIVLSMGGDDTNIPIGQIAPIANKTSSGFSINFHATNTSGSFDPALVMLAVIVQ